MNPTTTSHDDMSLRPPTSRSLFPFVRLRIPRWIGRSIFVIALVAFLRWTGAHEVARWYEAKALNALSDGDLDTSIKAVNTAMWWHQDSPELLEVRALLHLRRRDFQASLNDYQRISELAAADGIESELDMRPLAASTQVLQQMGRGEEAIAVWDRVVAFRMEEYRLRDDDESRELYALALNNRAYMKAQQGIDTANAIDEVRLGIELTAGENDPVMLDTLGYLLLKDGQADVAVSYLEKATMLTEVQNAALRQQINQRMRQVIDQRPFEDYLKTIDQQYSIILHHLGEARAAAGKHDQASRDLARALELGYDPMNGIW